MLADGLPTTARAPSTTSPAAASLASKAQSPQIGNLDDDVILNAVEPSSRRGRRSLAALKLAAAFPDYGISKSLLQSVSWTGAIPKEYVDFANCISKWAGHRATRAEIIRVLGSGYSGVVMLARRSVNSRFTSHTKGVCSEQRTLAGRRKGQELQPIGIECSHDFVAVKYMHLRGKAYDKIQAATREASALTICRFFSIVRCRNVFVKREDMPPANLDELDSSVWNCRDGLVAMVIETEYMNNGDLSMELKARRREMHHFTQAEVLLIFCQILMAVHYLHGTQRMLHLDIKSANILLCSNGLVKLSDFGFSVVCEDGDVDAFRWTRFCGTSCYMAPEMWLRKPYNRAADLYSLGVLLYELLTLTRPFYASDIMSFKELVTTQPPPVRPVADRYDPFLIHLATVLMSKDPNMRPTAIEILCTPLLREACGAFLCGVHNAPRAEHVSLQGVRETVPPDISGCSVKDGVSSDEGGALTSITDSARQQLYTDVASICAEVTLRLAKQSETIHSFNSDLLCPPPGIGVVYILAEGMLWKHSGGAVMKSCFLQLINRPLSGMQHNYEVLLSARAAADMTHRQATRRSIGEYIDVYPLSSTTADEEPSSFAMIRHDGRFLEFTASTRAQRDYWVSIFGAAMAAYLRFHLTSQVTH